VYCILYLAMIDKHCERENFEEDFRERLNKNAKEFPFASVIDLKLGNVTIKIKNRIFQVLSKLFFNRLEIKIN
jgi:hypothetical protein